jgi:hypothetical protein
VEKKSLAYRYFVVGLGFIFIAYLFYAVSAFNNAPSKAQFWFYTAGVAGLVCFALSLAHRLDAMEQAGANTLRKLLDQLHEKEGMIDRMNAAEARKAAERTAELERQGREIERHAREIKRQAREIARLNQLLQQYINRPEPKAHPVQSEIDESIPHTPAPLVPVIPLAGQPISFQSFQTQFPDEEACLKFLDELKWSGGFTCRKCGCGNYTKGKKPYTRRCIQCRHPESVISFTLFSNLKFPIVKAFYVTYLVSSGKAITVDELSEILSLRRQTCWAFKRKVKEIMHRRQHLPKPEDGWSHLVLNVEAPEAEAVSQ